MNLLWSPDVFDGRAGVLWTGWNLTSITESESYNITQQARIFLYIPHL